VVHVSAQVVVAYFYLGVGVWGYLPWLALASIVTGAITGTACVLLLRNKALVRYLRGEKTLPE
ncbi:MAG: hypothetical protein K6E59_06610, partial [Bacilli bacterium]|nr:hypothetical protein [Bacilli bacterium]